MSWSTWTEYGFGVPLFTGENFEAVKKFLIKNELNPKIAMDLPNAKDEIDLQDCYDDPLPWIVAKIIRDETGYESFIGFASCGDTDFEEHIGFSQDFPWHLKGKDAKLTLDEADRVLKKYIDELGINDLPDYFEAHYCG